MRRILQVLAIIVLIIVIAYFGMCIYGNVKNDDYNPDIGMPSKGDAKYSLIVRNTATVILTDEYEVFGSVVGNRTYYLTNYWELKGAEFVYRDSSVTLPESVFGQIDVKRR